LADFDTEPLSSSKVSKKLAYKLMKLLCKYDVRQIF